jgi:hypothetical protein
LDVEQDLGRVELAGQAARLVAALDPLRRVLPPTSRRRHGRGAAPFGSVGHAVAQPAGAAR